MHLFQSLLLHISKIQSDLDEKTELLADVTAENSDLKKDLKVSTHTMCTVLCRMCSM